MKANITLCCLVALCTSALAEQTNDVRQSSLPPDLSPTNIVVNYLVVLKARPFEKTISIQNPNDILTIVTAIRTWKPGEGICGCHFYSIVLNYKEGKTISVPWPHGNKLFESDVDPLHYEIRDEELRSIWKVLLRNGIDPEAVPSELKDLLKQNKMITTPNNPAQATGKPAPGR